MITGLSPNDTKSNLHTNVQPIKENLLFQYVIRIKSNLCAHIPSLIMYGNTGLQDKTSNAVVSMNTFVFVQSLSHVWLFVTPWTAACQTPLSSTICWTSDKFMSIQSVLLSNHPILCHSLLLPSIFPSIRVFSDVAKVLELQLLHQSFQWTLRTDLF